MPQVTINYKKPETLNILKSLAKYLEYTFISECKDKTDDLHDFKRTSKKYESLADRNIPITDDPAFTPGDPSINIDELREIFTGRNIDAKQLRKDAWTRRR